ncbi:hypothetical protein LCGC14_1049980 [marine sediment metagenome]|uniref:DNA-directed RNA polymerase M/15kDa subunit domain-containing protein n=1 Tax=marine sediment metagenome TaxID=412755 RepID=A0A0F9NAW6_9ZZZZ
MNCPKCGTEMMYRLNKDANSLTFICPQCLYKDIREVEPQ